MQKSHIILLDPHGTILDYTADTECLAAVFNVLLQYGAELQKTTKQTTPVTPSVDESENTDNFEVLFSGDGWEVWKDDQPGRCRVVFEEKPNVHVREELKRHGFWWNRTGCHWEGAIDQLPAQYTKPQRIRDMEARSHRAAPVDLDVDIPTIGAKGPRCKPVEHETPVKDLPAPGTVVRLTGGYDEPSIARGDSIADSTVSEADTTGDDDPFLASLAELFKRN